MKYFISQPMANKTDEQIKAERDQIISAIKEEDSEAIILESFFEGAPHDAKPMWFLGKSIQVLADADIIYCAEGWEKARGCVIEHDCALLYGLVVIEHNKEE